MILQLLLIPLFLCLTPVLFAQSADTGAIFGTVIDRMGAVLPEAKVSLTNQRTGSVKTITSNSSGFYDFEALGSSDYSISITRDGFKTSTTKDILINPGQRREVASKLEVGSISTSVTVESNPLQVKTETSDNSTTVASEEISTLLVNGRNFQSLATLVPGVNNTNGNSGYSGGGLTSSTSLAIGGSGIDNTTYEIDGVYNMNTGNYNNINITPSMDVISVFSVLKSNYSARYGTASSSVVLVDTKSGTKDYHGTVWNYFRNDAMDSSNYYSNGTKSKLRQNVYGFSFGGPLQIPKLYNRNREKQTFFFASDEWWKRTNGNSRTANVITSAMRDNGNLAGSRGLPSLTPDPLKDPTGGLYMAPGSDGVQMLAAEGKTNCITSPQTLNPACFDADALAILKAYQPTENAVDPSGNQSYNYLNNQSDTFAQIDHDYRVDHNFGPNEALTGRIMYEETNSFSPASTWGGGSEPTITTSIYTSGLNAMMRLTSSLTPTIVNTASIAETYDKPRLHTSDAPYPAGVNIALFYPNAYGYIPNISVSSYDNIGVGSLPVNASDGEGIVNDDLTVVRGKHTLQAGGFYVFGIKNQIVANSPWGSLTFNGHYTGSGAADFLLGLHNGYSQPITKPHYSAHYRSTEFYVQDDWKATPRLVVNAGVRFFYYSPDWLTGNGTNNLTSNFQFANFDAAQAPVVRPDGSFQTAADGITPITSAGTPANLQNGLVFSPSAGVPRGFYDSTTVYTAPRVGFAYALTNDGRTSVHAGYGIGDTRIPFQIVNAYGSNPPGVTSVNFVEGTFENPAPASSLTVAVPRPQGLTLVNLKFRPSQFQNFSLIVEREVVHGAIFQVGYAGSLGRYLHEGIDANQVLPTSTPYASDCLASGQSPSATYDYDPCLNAGSPTLGTISSDYLRPTKGWDSLGETLYSGNSSYNSLQSQFKYVKKSVQTTLNYTFSKSLGDSTNSGQDFRTEVSSTQNSYCITCEHGVLNFDRTHMFTGNVIYELPFYTNGTNRIMKGALGGWSVSGIAIAQSGFALTPTMSNPNSGMASRPNQVGKIVKSSDRSHIFNRDAFEVPGYGFFGNASNGSLRGTKNVGFNTALYKTFAFTERANFQFRAEAFNLANHPSFSNANTGIGLNEPNPGLVNSPQDPRILEMVGRFTF
jgi:hypothetical protein